VPEWIPLGALPRRELQTKDSMHTPAFSGTCALRTIAIVGAGFSGTAVATHLLRLSGAHPLRIVLIDREHMTRGIAYAKRGFPYLLNVPAGRMSANSQDPDGFVNFARRRLGNVGREDFLPRELYGDYLEWSLENAELGASAEVNLERIRGHVIALERDRNGGILLLLEDGRRIEAESTVLALGNPPPGQLKGSEAVSSDPRWVGDPWAAGPLRFRPREQVLIVGSGLTMADMVLSGHESSQGGVVFHALSRHGLIPPAQRAARPHTSECDGRRLAAASISLRQLFREVRAHAEQAQLTDGDWREVITQVRGLAPALWARLDERERRRFLRHVRAYWDSHRHRLPESTWVRLDELQRRGALHVHAGHISGFQRTGKQIEVRWRPRGADSSRTLKVDRVLNCTGPDYDLRRSSDRLLRSLLAQGMARADALGLGLMTDAHGALQDARGPRQPGRIYYVGPMLRPQHWEVTAVQELRVHAERLAAHLVAPLLAERVTSASPSAGISSVSVPASRGLVTGAGSSAAARS
jgi:uncharacterized NAD(P)/FAD-binding protein YdhS